MANVIILVIGHHIPMQQIEKLLTIACLIFVLIDKDLTKNRDDCIQSLEREQNIIHFGKRAEYQFDVYLSSGVADYIWMISTE